MSQVENKTLYIKASQSKQVTNKRIILSDVLDIISLDNDAVKRAGDIVLHTVKGDRNEKVIFSITKVINMIQKECPAFSIVNIGEPDFVVEYKIPVKPNTAWEYTKLAITCIIVFFGAAFTIMTFNTDVSVGDVFDDFYKIVKGVDKNSGSILEISYSIGIPIGILCFYNHFKSDKVHDDPTPVHIEMRKYEEDMNKAIIKDADREETIRK